LATAELDLRRAPMMDALANQQIARALFWGVSDPVAYGVAEPATFIASHLQIKRKDGAIIPFLPNSAQQYFDQHYTGRDIILKPRQLGFTTYTCGRFFTKTLLVPGTVSAVVAHNFDSTEKIFRIVRLFWDRLPVEAKTLVGPPAYSNRRELFWPKTQSAFYVLTAGTKDTGRGGTINNLLCSEFAFWSDPDETMTSVTQAVPLEEGQIVIESTANGLNQFHQRWQQAKGADGGYTPHFFRWFDDPSYLLPGEPLELTEEEGALAKAHGLSHGQIRWRRAQIAELGERFQQEYPEDDVSCFLSTGRCVFETDLLRQRMAVIAAAQPPSMITALQRPHPMKRAQTEVLSLAPARLLVWEDPAPGQSYAIGADVGEGLANGDASAAVVVNRRSGRQAAELHGRIPPERFAHLLDCLGRWYHKCLVAVERNNHGHSTLNTLLNTCRYQNLYFHVRYDGGRPVLGWPTDQITKPLLVDNLAAALSSEAFEPRSAELVDEMLSFVSREDGTQGAEDGHFDDRVIAAGIALQAAKRAVAAGSRQRPAGW